MESAAEQTQTVPDVASDISNEVLERFGERFGIKADLVIPLLRRTAFKRADTERQLSNAETLGILAVAEQHKLNPFASEIYAVYDPARDKFLPVVGVDGWLRIINSHPQFDGMDFSGSGVEIVVGHSKSCDSYISCTIFRKDHNKPTVVAEYLDECYVDSVAWNTKTRRQLRHKALIQCARYAFGFTGIYDQDEANAIIASGIAEVVNAEAGAAGVTAPAAEAAQAAAQNDSAPAKTSAPTVVVTKPIAALKKGLGALEIAKSELKSADVAAPTAATAAKKQSEKPVAKPVALDTGDEVFSF